MDYSADKQIAIARTLFNIAHSYLTKIDTDDEQEDKYEDNEKDKTIKKDIQQTKEEEVNGYGKYDDTFDKKQEKNSGLDNEIEFYLQVQVDSKFQQQLCTNVQNKDLKNPNPEIEIELKIEIPQEFDNSYLKNIDKEKQHFKEEVKKKSKKNNEFNQKKERENKQELIYPEINTDSEFRHGIKREIKLKQNISKENVLVDFGRKNINSLNTQDQTQKGIEIKSQVKGNSEVLLEHELHDQKNIHEDMESFNESVKTRIERLICEIPSNVQNIQEELYREIEELNNEISELNLGNFKELNIDVSEENSKKNYFPIFVNIFKNLYCSFIQDLTPFYNRLDQLSNDKTQTTVQHKLNDEFLKKLDILLQQKCNEGHQQVGNKMIRIVNQGVKMVKENKKFELKRAVGLQVNHEIEINGDIKVKDSQQNHLRQTQGGVNKDERVRNQLKEIDRKEKFQHYDLVIQYNHEISQELNGHAQPVLGKKIIVDFYQDAVKKFMYKYDKEELKKKLCKAGTDVIDQNQKEENKNIQVQLEFYKKVEEELQEKNEKQLQNYTEEEINQDLKVKSKENETEIQEDSDVEIEEFEEEMQDHFEIANNEHFEEVHENSKFKIGALERAIIVDSGVKIKYSENELQEDSDVDVEGFEGEILEFPEVKIDDFYEEPLENSDLDTEDLSDEEFNDINEVIEIVEDIKVESYYSVDDYIPSDKIPTSTCNEFNLKMDPNSKLTYNEEEKLKISSDPTIFTEHIKEKQTFTELKHQLNELSQEYKGYVQKKVFKELQHEVDDKQLQEMEKFPDTFNEVNLKTDEDFQKEIDELQNELCELKPEFMSDVPLSFEDDKSSKKFKKKSFNLFEKLYSIHRQLLHKFSESNEWPEKYFQPSCLLDVLFDDPTEFKPNVLVIILHSIDQGYSIKINTDRNSKSPKEYSFSYYEDTILEHMETEHLPPDLMDLLVTARPRLFYSGCVIAEIHDQRDEVPGRVYRLILRPSIMSIQRDIDLIITNNSDPTDKNFWSIDRRLGLESEILKKVYPVMCMDPSPLAGLVVQLQHQVLSRRTIVLNPLKRKNNFSKPIPLKTDLYNEPNDSLNTSMLSNESQGGSSKLMNTENTNIDNYILWKFDFRIKSLNLFKMFIMVITETLEISMVLCTNPKVDSIKKILRFKIQPQQYELRDYINIMLKIFQQRISSEIEVVRRYKFQGYSTPHSLKSVPSPLNENIYKANHADISQLVDIFINNSHIKYIPINKKLENMCTHDSGITKIKNEKSDLSLMQDNLDSGTQKTNETKENYKVIKTLKKVCCFVQQKSYQHIQTNF
ncbi:MATH and LRR domain-containing protein PFE0570w-like isoform X2 [Metopolophium dirhodum]|uniref:MATH and LRR domain-containing protein PFE0570w-like isoform X2 n=1 Tax=Metopolophium dirhodum TaxID=44670 RepID=UPI00298FBE47|nr:MATH and LRR domain-containing protein PFE0570w-like isoform X2 [Metopolophium dirhodum]